jgi:hypothetical protein
MIRRTFFQAGRTHPLTTPGAGADFVALHEAVVRAAWLYYAEGMTQARIARDLRVPRARVIAWLALAAWSPCGSRPRRAPG